MKGITYYALRLGKFFSNRLSLIFSYYALRDSLPNLKKPSNLSEWMIARILNNENIKYSDLADKVKVREFVKNKGLEELLPKIFGPWKLAEDIDFESLPNKFVIKTNHGCGYNIICTDKSKLDIPATRMTVSKWLSAKYSKIEKHYNNISPLVFCEEFLENPYRPNSPPEDYKFMCFNGEPFCIVNVKERSPKPIIYIFDLNWNLRPDYMSNSLQKMIQVEKPINFDKMVHYARILSKDFEFVRVDLYDLLDKVIFGEFTFTPAAGIMSYFKIEPLIKMRNLINQK